VSVQGASDEAVIVLRADERLVPSGVYRLSARIGGEQQVDAFWLDRHPVTVERYAAFIEAGGYDDREHWDDEGWDWKIEHDVECPRFWDEPEWKRFLRRGRPVVGVSWFEARAFASFEGRRLPGERELEAAARGPHGWVYTWGDVWEEGRLGIRGVGPRMTWPVGFFRGGRAAFGHDDLLGNVWQWTTDPKDPQHPERAYIVRGGSWASRPDQNTNESWNAYEPGARFSHLGFRTARHA
jgi:formylglycine-generating enzyme required for sulfatase activity